MVIVSEYVIMIDCICNGDLLRFVVIDGSVVLMIVVLSVCMKKFVVMS